MVTYNSRTGRLGSYEPRFQSIDPESFLKIAQAVDISAAYRAATDNGPESVSPVGRLSFTPGLESYLGVMKRNAQMDNLKKNPEQFFKGKTRKDLSPELRKLYDQVESEKKKAGWGDNIVGGLGRVLDVLSRFNYGSAEAVKRVWEKSMEEDDESWLENLGEAFGDAGKGFVSGVKGKDKTTYSNVLQTIKDSQKALSEGKDPNKVPYGYNKLDGGDRFLKGLLGFTLDVALDPTTYVGIGAVKAGLKAAKVGEKEVDDLAGKLFGEYGVKINDIDDVEPVKGMLNPKRMGVGLDNMPHNAEARAARINNFQLFTSTVKATVAAKERARFRAILTEQRKADYRVVPKVDVETSGPKFMDVPANAEDLASYHRYTRIRAANAQRRANLDPTRDADEIALLDRELADAERRFNDYFNVSDVNVEALAKANAHVKMSDEIKQIDQQIRTKRDEIRKLEARPKKNPAAIAKAKDELTLLQARRETRFVDSLENAAAKVAPDKGTLVSKVRRSSDIQILRELSESSLDDGIEHSNVLRRELSYRFAEKGDAWLSSVVAKAGNLSDGLVEDLRNLTPLKRPGKHTIKRRQMVQIEQAKSLPTKKDVDAALAHNRKIDNEVNKAAEKKALEIAEGVEQQLLEIMVRETTPAFKRQFALKLNIPFTKANTPNTAKVMFAMGLPDAVTQALNKYVFRDTVKEGLTKWGNFFKSSAGSDPLLNRMRLSYNGAANFRIEEHANRLRSMWQGVKPAERKAALRQWLKLGDKVNETASGPYAEMVRQINEEFTLLAKSLQVTYPGGFKITATDFNHWLPEKLQFSKLAGPDKSLPVGSPDWVRASLRHLNEDADPAELLWHMHVAREKVLVRTAMKDNVRQLFGVERHADNEKMVQTLIKQHGYKNVPELGPEHLFPPDVADDITKAFDLMKNQKEVLEIIKYFDSVMTVYKSTVTMWNPGYHMRNSFGDGFMNYLAGVSGKSGLDAYRNSAKVLRSMKGLSNDNPVHSALMQINPKAAFDELDVKPATVMWTNKYGRKVTAEEVWVLYNHYGLHSGFVANEFGKGFGHPGSLRSTGIGQKATAANRGVQNLSENREDFFRLAHFIHVMRSAKHDDLLAAGAEAADSVRKYMFDYSDFTQIEKQVMLRLIPFYKWTRKAIPLMAETLFAQPGKALMYPKAMRNLSAMMGYDLGDENGIIPASDVIIPEWVRQRGMYPIGSQDGNTILADAAIPSNDVIRTVSSPMDALFSMLSPAIRIPMELKTGERFYHNIPIRDKSEYASTSIPQGAFINQMLKKNKEGDASGVKGVLSDPRFIQFLSGIGIHENTEKQMKNELTRQSYEASQRNRKDK
jgi:hypothetical protein